MATELEDLKILGKAESVAEVIWGEVSRWDRFAKDTIGKQVVRSVDSIGANIAEGFGRFHFGEKIKFLYYSRGSLYETKYWINQASKRGLLKEQVAKELTRDLNILAKQLNQFIKSLKAQKQMKTTKISEEPVIYQAESDGDEQWLATDHQSPVSNLYSRERSEQL